MSQVQDIMTTAVVRKIPTLWDEETIKGALQCFGDVAAVTYPPSNAHPKAATRATKVAFVRFTSEDGAKKAIEADKVNWSTPDQTSSGAFEVVAFVERVAKPRTPRQPKAPNTTAAPVKRTAPKKARKPLAPDATAVVVKNIPRTLNKQQIAEAFAGFGEIVRVITVNKRFTKAKTTAFIVFKEQAGVDTALANPVISLEVDKEQHEVTISKFEAREPRAPAQPRAAAAGGAKPKRAPRTRTPHVPEPENTIVIRAIPVALTEEQVKAAIATVGGVEAIRFVGVRETSQFKVAYVLMSTADAVAAALAKTEVNAADAKLSIVPYSAERPLNPRVVITRIPLSYTKEQIEALVKEFGEAEVTIFEPRQVEGQEPIVRTAQAAQYRFATQEGVKAAIAKKTIAIDDENNMIIRPYRFRTNRRAPVVAQ